MKRLLVFLLCAVLGTAAYALPTIANVEAEIHKGNYAQAESMMHEVVVAKPGSAKAHYIYAEILAHNAKFGDAAAEAQLARQSDPSLKFTDPEKFRAFEQLLEREQQRSARSSASATSLDNLGPGSATTTVAAPRPLRPAEERGAGLPSWVWPVGLGALAFVAWRMLSRGRTSSSTPALTGPTGMPYGSAPGYGSTPPYAPMGGGVAPSGAGGLMGVGLAAAGGVAAGMLAEKFLERGRDVRRDDNFLDRDAYANAAVPTDSDARALEERPVDFGSGNDWDAGSSDSAPMDPGTGGGDDGGW